MLHIGKPQFVFLRQNTTRVNVKTHGKDERNDKEKFDAHKVLELEGPFSIGIFLI